MELMAATTRAMMLKTKPAVERGSLFFLALTARIMPMIPKGYAIMGSKRANRIPMIPKPERWYPGCSFADKWERPDIPAEGPQREPILRRVGKGLGSRNVRRTPRPALKEHRSRSKPKVPGRQPAGLTKRRNDCKREHSPIPERRS